MSKEDNEKIKDLEQRVYNLEIEIEEKEVILKMSERVAEIEKYLHVCLGAEGFNDGSFEGFASKGRTN